MRTRAWIGALALAAFGCGGVIRPVAVPRIVIIATQWTVKPSPTFPNLTLVPAPGGADRVSLVPCGAFAAAQGFSTPDRTCARLAVKNLGPGRTESPVEVALWLDGSPIERWIVRDPLAPGGVAVREDISFGPLPPGLHFLRVVIDPANRIGETDKKDNAVTVAFSVSTPR